MGRPKRNEEEIAATVAELPLLPPDDVIEMAKRRLTAARLVYRAGKYTDPITGLTEKTALVKCTECGEAYHLEYVSFGGQGCSHAWGMPSDPFGFVDPLDNESKYSGQTCMCPNCGSGGKAIHIGKIRGREEMQYTFFLTGHNVRGHFVLLSWKLEKLCDKNADVNYVLKQYEGVSVIDGVAVRFVGYNTNMFYGVRWLFHWAAKPAFYDNCEEWKREDILYFDQFDFDASDAAHSALDVYIREGGGALRLGSYLRIWSKYPQIENLTRSGYSGLVKRLINASTERYSFSYTAGNRFLISKIPELIDVKKKKPHEMLRLEKDEMHLIDEFRLDELSFRGFIKQTQGVGLTKEQIEQMRKFDFDNMRRLFMKPVKRGFNPPVIRTLNYLLKANEGAKRSQMRVDASYLRDYWELLIAVYNDLPPDLLYPKDIREAHDRLVLLEKEKLDQKLDDDIRKVADTLKWAEMADAETGLFIKPCSGHLEIIKEGEILNHCVATYAKRYSKKETAIFFIRKIDDPDKPFFTLEFKNGYVVQNRGIHNCDRTEEVKLFEEKWLKYITNYKENANNGKRNDRNKAEQRAGA